MADEQLQEPAPETQAQNPTVEPAPAPPGPSEQNSVPEPGPGAAISRRSHRKLWIVGGITAAVVGLCSIACLALVVAGVGQALMERPPIEKILDSFMREMEAKDVETAYGLFSPRAQRQMPLTVLQKMLQGNNYALLEGYQTLVVENLNLKAAVNTNPDLPQGTVAEVNGTVSYEGGYKGKFTAVLEKVDGAWKLYNINITVPPDKFK